MLKIVIEDENGGRIGVQEIPDGDVSLSIGRHSDSDVLLSGGGVSRHHARLHVMGGTVFVEDTQSSAGTFVNDVQVTEITEVPMESVITVGAYRLRITDGDVDAPAPAPAVQAAPEPAPAPAPVVEAAPPPPEVNNFLDEFKNASVLCTPEIMTLKRSIHEDVLEKLNLSEDALKDTKNDEMLDKVGRALDTVLRERRHELPHAIPLDLFRQAMMDELIGYGPISPLLRSPRISEIMINGPDVVFV